MSSKLGDMFIALGLKDEKFKKGLRGVKKQTSTFSSQMSKLGGVIAASFAVSKIVSFGRELIDIGGKAKGIRTAFEALDNPKLLNEMRKAVKGTVSDLELMRNAVKANEFGIPLKNMGLLMKFAAIQAQKLGESVDSMLDSLIGSMSTQSKMRLDNLGISMSSMNKEMAKGKTFADAAFSLINEKLGDTSEVLETSATKVAKLTAAWQNLKVKMGEIISPYVADYLETIGSTLNGIKDTAAEISATAINLDKQEIKALSDAYLKRGIAKNKEEATQMAINSLLEQYRKLILSEDDLSARLKLIDQYNAIAAYSEEIVKSTGKISEEQKKVYDAQNKINVAKERELQLAWDLEILRAANKKDKDYTDFSTIYGNYEPPEVVDQEDAPFPYVDITTLEEQQEAFKKYGDTINAINESIAASAQLAASVLDEQSGSFVNFVAQVAIQVLRLIGIYQAEAAAAAMAGGAEAGMATGPASIWTTPAFMAAALASVLIIFASIPKFAGGGIIGGRSFSGDNMLIGANSGEMVLNGMQQRNLFKMLNLGGGGFPNEIMLKARGSDLIGVIYNENRHRN